MECDGPRSLRQRHGVEDGDRVSNLLLFGKRNEEEITRRKKYLTDIWRERKKIRQRIQ